MSIVHGFGSVGENYFNYRKFVTRVHSPWIGFGQGYDFAYWADNHDMYPWSMDLDWSGRNCLGYRDLWPVSIVLDRGSARENILCCLYSQIAIRWIMWTQVVCFHTKRKIPWMLKSLLHLYEWYTSNVRWKGLSNKLIRDPFRTEWTHKTG